MPIKAFITIKPKAKMANPARPRNTFFFIFFQLGCVPIVGCKINLECRQGSVTIGTFINTKGLFGDTKRTLPNQCLLRTMTTPSAP